MKKFLVPFLFIGFVFSSLAIAGPDEDAIKKKIADQASAESAFPRTLDIASVLKIFSPGALIIEDGKSESLEEIKQILLDIEEAINLGKTFGISSRVSNIQVQMLSSAYGIATYDFSHKAGMSGIVTVEQLGKCTSIMKKTGTGWLVYYQHCSTPKPKENNEGTVGVPAANSVE